MEILRFFRQVEGRVLPKLHNRIEAERFGHVRSVNHAFQAIIDRRYTAIHDELTPPKMIATDLERYGHDLEWVRQQYLGLTYQDQKDLAAAVALHDIGYLLDRSVAHGSYGAQLVGKFLLETGTRGVDSRAVAELVANHGFFMDQTVQFLPADAQRYSETRKTQLLVLNLCDIIGKIGGNQLSQLTLETLIGLRQGAFNDPQEYFDLRMRTLLGPICYSYLADELSYLTLMQTAEKALSPDDRQALFRNVAGRFRNTCWPVFQELGLVHKRVRPYFTLLLRLSRLAEAELKESKDVLLVFKPDFFSLSAAERVPYIRTLAENPNADILSFIKLGEHGMIVVDLQQLLRFGS